MTEPLSENQKRRNARQRWKVKHKAMKIVERANAVQRKLLSLEE